MEEHYTLIMRSSGTVNLQEMMPTSMGEQSTLNIMLLLKAPISQIISQKAMEVQSILRETEALKTQDLKTIPPRAMAEQYISIMMER